MLSIHSGREVPWIFGIEGITDNNLSSPIGSALLKMVTIRDSIILMAGAACLLGAIRNLTVENEVTPIESLQNDLLMQRDLGGDGSGI